MFKWQRMIRYRYVRSWLKNCLLTQMNACWTPAELSVIDSQIFSEPNHLKCFNSRRKYRWETVRCRNNSTMYSTLSFCIKLLINQSQSYVKRIWRIFLQKKTNFALNKILVYGIKWCLRLPYLPASSKETIFIV